MKKFYLFFLLLLLVLIIPNKEKAFANPYDIYDGQLIIDDDIFELDDEYILDLDPNKVSININKTLKLENYGVYDIDTIFWFSTDEDIVTVNENGRIKGCSPGTAYVVAFCYYEDVDLWGDEEFDCAGVYDICKITVKKNKPSYSFMKKKLKQLSKTSPDNYLFKETKKGKVCRLYILGVYSEDIKKDYGMLVAFNPYIEIKKNGNGSIISYKIQCEWIRLTIYEPDEYLSADLLRIYTKNNSVTYRMTETKYTSDYKDNITTEKVWANATLSSSKDKNASKLYDYNSILNKKSARIKVRSEFENTYFSLNVPTKCRKYWKSLLKKYKYYLKKYY